MCYYYYFFGMVRLSKALVKSKLKSMAEKLVFLKIKISICFAYFYLLDTSKKVLSCNPLNQSSTSYAKTRYG